MSLHEPKPPSIWKEGDRLRWRIENSVTCESTLHTCVCATLQCCANLLDPPAITHRCRGPPSFRERGLCFVALPCQFIALRCGVVPISRTRRLSPTASAVPPLSEKEGFPTLHDFANQPDPAAITHHYRGPPSFRKRGLLCCALSIVLFSSPSPVFFPLEYAIEQTLLICLHCRV